MMKILELLTKQRRIGNIGERIAAKELKKKGYKILKRNFVATDAEIDIICENKTTLAFVEVKTRTLGRESPREMRPASAVTPDKQRKIIEAAREFLATREKGKRISLDIVEVYLDGDGRKKSVLHIENAFNRNTAKKGYFNR